MTNLTDVQKLDIVKSAFDEVYTEKLQARANAFKLTLFSVSFIMIGAGALGISTKCNDILNSSPASCNIDLIFIDKLYQFQFEVDKLRNVQSHVLVPMLIMGLLGYGYLLAKKKFSNVNHGFLVLNHYAAILRDMKLQDGKFSKNQTLVLTVIIKNFKLNERFKEKVECS